MITKNLLKIDLPLFDLKYDKNIRKTKHNMVLTDTMLIYEIECYLDKHPKPDDDLGIIKPDQYLNQTDHIWKSSIYWIKCSFDNSWEVWLLEIFFGNQDTYCNFETEAEMREVEKKLLEWLGK